MLALLVEVAALEAQGAGCVGHVVMMAAEFGKQYFPFEGLHALGKSAGFHRRGGFAITGRGKGQVDFLAGDRFAGREQQDALDHVPQFADIAGPRIALQNFQRFGRKMFLFPSILRRDLRREILGKDGNLFGSLPQAAAGQWGNT